MLRHKIDYGIDLGTTNSSIARVEEGQVRIIKNPETQMDTTPSAVHYTRRKQRLVGVRAYDKFGESREDRENTFIEFKRTMGTDKQYYSSRTGEHYSSEMLSAEVLKSLKSFVRDEDEVSAAIISVPAGFQQRQIHATQRSAEMAGFKYCELLQEPIAASLAYGVGKRSTEGYWLVFDLGGGTFDAALVRMTEGIMEVVDHEGDNHLGGKDMDWLIVDNIIIPHLKTNFRMDNTLRDTVRRANLKSVLRRLTERAKITLSTQEEALIELYGSGCEDDAGEEIDTAIEIQRPQLENIIEKSVDRAIKKTVELITRNRLCPDELETVLLIGGPTYTPYLRERVKQEINKNINVTIDPMTAVVKGAAIFASTRPVPRSIQKRDLSEVQLILGYPDTTVESEIPLGLRIDREKTRGEVPDKIFAEIARSDKGWATGRMELRDDTAMIRLHLLENKTNGFSIQLYDGAGNRLGCWPNSFSILQGIKVAAPPLPHDIGISAVKTDGGYADGTLVAVLRKNQPLPAVGTRIFKTPKNIRPGKSDDVLKIIVWEGKEGTRPLRNAWVGQMVISGDKLASLLPEGSDLEITIRMDESRRIVVTADLPYLDETLPVKMEMNIEKRDPGWTSEAVGSIRTRLDVLREEGRDIQAIATDELDGVEAELYDIEESQERSMEDFDQGIAVKNRANELLMKLDELEQAYEWPKLEKQAKDELGVAGKTIDRDGTERESQTYERLKTKLEKSIEAKDAKSVETVISDLADLKWRIWSRKPEFWVWTLKNISDYFDETHWADRARARNLLDEGTNLLNESGYTDDIPRIVRQLWKLMPEPDVERTRTIRKDIPIDPIYPK